jgi:hypothetical protein
MVRDTDMRVNLWESLRSDDAVALVRALLCHGFRSAADLQSLRWRMWRGGAGKGGRLATGLLCVAATNVAGVPGTGAVECIAAVLERFGRDAWLGPDRERACARVRELRRARVEELMKRWELWIEPDA